ncbi:cell adhesion molecule CEACAM3-like [Glossophaga mutica]
MVDAGIYTVAVEKQNSKILIGYAELNVYRRVRKPTLGASNTTVTENKDTVVLTCYSNAPTIQWLFNGTKLQPTEQMKLSMDHRRLTIDPVKREDAGNYQCEASNPISSVASSLLTFWSLPTTAKISIASTYAAEGKDVVLHIHNKPPEVVGITWYKGKGVDLNNVIAFFILTSTFHLSAPGNNGRQILKDDGSLLLKNITIKDAGIYTVVVHFPDSKTEVGFGQLDVYEHLRVPILLASSYGVLENEDDVVLTCYTNGLSIQWLFNDMDLNFTDRMKLTMDDRRLTIDPVKREDDGGYKCKASNPIMWVERRVRKPTLGASNTTVTENKDTVVLTCYSNAPTIQWLFNGTKLQPTEQMKLSMDHRRLTIDPVKREDAGNYQCEASNPISSVAISLLTFWSLPTTAKISIASTYAAEGKDVVLHIHNKPPEVVGITWYKGKGVDLNNVIAFFILTSTFHLSAPGNNGRQILKDDGSLLLKNITIKDAGIYTVVVHFPDSKTEVGFGQLDVYEHLRVPILLASSYGVLENEDDVVLTCYTNGLSIQWLVNDMDLNFTDRMKLTMDGRRLTIDPVKREDDGGYKCKASNPIMWVERRVRKPTLGASNTTVTENKDTVVLTCYSNAPTIQWLFNGTKLQPTEQMKLSMDHRRLTIDPVKREDAGNYQCEASNPISSVASSLLTFWSLPTTAKISIASTYAAEGKDVVLHIHNKPPEVVGITWYKGKGVDLNNVIAFFILTSTFHLSAPGNNGQQILKDDGSLLLKNITIKDAGIYTVVVHFPDSKTEVGFGQLDVYEHLRVPILLASSYGVLENEDDVVLTCYTNGLSIQWLFNDMDLNFTDRMKLTMDDRRLTIDPVKREDDGGYKCKASNPIMWVESQPLELHVLY